MLDFKELDKNGDDFELLIRELLHNKGLEVYWSGKGPDGGKDLLCIERYQSHFKSFTRRWLVQCKHNAHSGKAVGAADLEGIENACGLYNADGYLLVCSTYPSSAVVRLLEEIERRGKITTAFWDWRALERQLLTPDNWSIVDLFFPDSAKRLGWQISKIDTGFWHANYRGHILYFSLRIGTNCDWYLKDVADRLDELDRLELPEGHYLRLRAVYFDDKYTNFTLFLDYLLPEQTPKDYRPPDDVIRLCSDRVVAGIYYNVDLKIYACNQYSDNFDPDHHSYYAYHIANFRTGIGREQSGPFRSVFRDDPRMLTEKTKNEAFEALADAFGRLPFVNVLRATNAKVEDLAYFSDNFSWRDTIEGLDYQIHNFFDAEIRFECDDFAALCQLLTTFPTSVMQHFELEQNHIFLPDRGYEQDGAALYTLKIMVHPAIGVSKLQFRQYLNQYMTEITEKIQERL